MICPHDVGGRIQIGRAKVVIIFQNGKGVANVQFHLGVIGRSDAFADGLHTITDQIENIILEISDCPTQMRRLRNDVVGGSCMHLCD